MAKASSDFQIFVKPVGSSCNLNCTYCYYLDKGQLYPGKKTFRMQEDLLEDYIRQHIEASPSSTIQFSWHGGEPTLMGIEYFRKIVVIQGKYKKSHQKIINGIQTNGTLLNEDWCQFFAKEGFIVGISIDGPQEFHDLYRISKTGKSSFEQTLRGYQLLKQYEIPVNILCVVHAHNVKHPLEIYRFFKGLRARYIEFLPLVEKDSLRNGTLTSRTVRAEDFGEFLCTIFDEWLSEDIENMSIQIFEEVARTALGQEHALCIFNKTCGRVPVLEHNGDLFACDHFMTPEYRQGNIREKPLAELLESPTQKAFGENKWKNLPHFCQTCEVLKFCYGGCPKDRILQTAEGESGLNYLCKGFKRFFTHCQHFVNSLSSVWKSQSPNESNLVLEMKGSGRKIGRNDPCPCGSGKKYKRCCLNK